MWLQLQEALTLSLQLQSDSNNRTIPPLCTLCIEVKISKTCNEKKVQSLINNISGIFYMVRTHITFTVLLTFNIIKPEAHLTCIPLLVINYQLTISPERT